MSDIRFNQWLHNSGTGGVSQVDGGHVGIGTTNPEIAVHSGNNKILNVGIVTASTYYGDGSNLSGIVGGGTSLSFNDNIGAYFGNSQDLKIHHDGNHSYIDDQGTGNLRLRSGTLEVLNLAGNKTSAIFSSGGGQTLNFNNGERFVTTNEGVTFSTGSSSCVVRLTSNNSSVHILQAFNSDLNIKAPSGGGINLLANGTEDAIKCISNGSVELYHNGNRQVFTIDGGMNWQDSKKAEFGNSGDLKIYNASSVNHIYGATNQPIIISTNTTERLRIASTGEMGLGLTQDPPTGSFTIRLTETPEFNLYSTQQAQNNNCKINFGIGQSASVSGNTGARIEMNIPNAGGQMNGELKFHTNSGDNLQERLKIDSSGYVVIGHTSANAKLHIASGSSTAVGDATNPALQIGGTTNYRFAVRTTSEQAIIANKNGDDGIAFHTKTGNSGSFGEAVRITSAGYMQTLSNPSFRAGLNSNTTFNQNTNIIFNDTGATWHYNRGNHYNTGNGRFTAPVSGVYQFNASVIWYGAPNNTFMGDAFHFYVNNGNACYSGRRGYYNTGTTGNSLYYTDHMSVNLYLNATDYVNIRQSAPVATVHGNTYYTWFAGSFLG